MKKSASTTVSDNYSSVGIHGLDSGLDEFARPHPFSMSFLALDGQILAVLLLYMYSVHYLCTSTEHVCMYVCGRHTDIPLCPHAPATVKSPSLGSYTVHCGPQTGLQTYDCTYVPRLCGIYSVLLYCGLISLPDCILYHI